MEEDAGPSEASGLLSSLQRYSGLMAVVAAVAAFGMGLYFARHTVPGSTINAKLFTLYALAEKVRVVVLCLGRCAVPSHSAHVCGCLCLICTCALVCKLGF